MKYFILLSSTAIAAAIVGSATLSATEQLPVSNEITGTIKAVKKVNVPILRYTSSFSKEGRILVELEEENVVKGARNRDVMTIYAPNVRATEKLLHSQDWYMTVGPNGGMRGIYTVPRDTALPSSVLRSLGEGHGIMKVNPRNSFFKVFPSKYQLASQLATFSEAARKSVCSQATKPETLNASVDVKPGWSSAGRITFNATWKVSELCKPKS